MKCWFCETNDAEPKYSSRVRLKKRVSYKTYANKTIEVPRCRSCKTIHEKDNLMMGLVIIAVSCTVPAIILLFVKYYWISAILFALSIPLWIGFIRTKGAKQSGIKAPLEKVYYPDVERLKGEGWFW